MPAIEKAYDKREIRRIQLARSIVQIARKAEWKVGFHLTEESLSIQLGVSRSPVRAAFKLLEDWGMVENQPNHGYFLKKSGAALQPVGQVAPPSVEEALYHDIIDARLIDSISDRVTQVDLQSHFKKSRIVIDQVLRRMVDEGLVERRKGHGWQFQRMFEGSHSWQKGYEIRRLLEPSLIMLPDFKIDHEKLTACEIAHRQLISAASEVSNVGKLAYKIDSNFHELIASFSDNHFILRAIQHQNRMRRLLEYRSYTNRDRITDWCQEHLDIISSLENADVQKASEQMLKHLTTATELMLEQLSTATEATRVVANN